MEMPAAVTSSIAQSPNKSQGMAAKVNCTTTDAKLANALPDRAVRSAVAHSRLEVANDPTDDSAGVVANGAVATIDHLAGGVGDGCGGGDNPTYGAPRSNAGACQLREGASHHVAAEDEQHGKDVGWSEPYGLQSPGLTKATGTEATCSEKVAFLQSWLFFGALAETYAACNLLINPDDYTADTFDTARLNGLPLRLYYASQRSGSAGSEGLRKKLYSIVRQGQLMMTRASDWEDEHDYTLTQCEVLYSIHILLRILSLALLCQSPQPIHDDLNISVADVVADWKPEGQMSMMGFTTRRLLESGWCQSELWHFLQGFDIATAACYLARPYAPRNHDKCSDTTCMAYQTDEQSYRTLHVKDNCNCEFVCVKPDLLADFLARNIVPAIVISDDLQLSVVDAKELDYVAFSHVWADGLGNPSRNALRSCQIRRLYNLAVNLCSVFKFNSNSSTPKVAIWIDTLCIPVAPELQRYRKQAIRLLARTYTEAMAVLVLDRELCRFESRKAPALELSIRVLCSGWFKRLWTLQEASLASDIEGVSVLYIQMADGPAHWDRLTRCFQYKPPGPGPPSLCKPSAAVVSIREVKADLLYEMHLMTAMEDRIPSVRAINSPGFGTRFQKVMHAVRNRCTSKREDEPVCLASLLGLDLQPILNANYVDDRMVAFYRLLREVPTAALFAEFGVPEFLTNNLTIPSYRWAPRSLLLLQRPMEIDNAFSAMHFMNPPLPILGECEEDGLHIRHPGFIFEGTEPTSIARQSTLLDTTDQKSYSLSLALSDNSPQSIGPLRRCALIFKSDRRHGFAKVLWYIPVLYTDNTVWECPNITRFPSACKAALESFWFGLFQGLTDWVMLPYKGAKSEGVLGCIKGFCKGICSFVFKPAAGKWE
ncbi:hypothetical protein DL764_005228 [Monosporascus ibericus]|uniref:Heterokaryon incompatibility domain-containing protein n=1 Tax=Monosporascus ibericus TaxID=155417 RepID=A0A4Q4TCX6_9PEZI|nr:hypothetical protein DL764_005228 [Monosporascus ibericus]